MGTRRTTEDRIRRQARDQALLQRSAPAASHQAQPDRRQPQIRHCWIRAGDHGVEALLIAWIHTPTGWHAEVATIDDAGALLTKTVPAADVLPARPQ